MVCFVWILALRCFWGLVRTQFFFLLFCNLIIHNFYHVYYFCSIDNLFWTIYYIFVDFQWWWLPKCKVCCFSFFLLTSNPENWLLVVCGWFLNGYFVSHVFLEGSLTYFIDDFLIFSNRIFLKMPQHFLTLIPLFQSAIVKTESITYDPSAFPPAQHSTTSVPLVVTESRKVAFPVPPPPEFSSDGDIGLPLSEDGEIVSSSTVSSKTKTVETITVSLFLFSVQVAPLGVCQACHCTGPHASGKALLLAEKYYFLNVR